MDEIDISPHGLTGRIVTEAVKLGGAANVMSTVRGVGVGVAGMIDRKGKIAKLPNIPGWEGIALPRLLGQGFNWIPATSIFTGHDGKTSAYAEYRFGAGRRSKSLMYVTLSTGVGAGFVYEGEVQYGFMGLAGEIGHMRSGRSELRKCGCGLRDCVETYASGPAMVSTMQEQLQAGKAEDFRAFMRTAGILAGDMKAEHLAAAARARIASAVNIFWEVGTLLGTKFGEIATANSLDCIVVGGGVGRNCWDLLFPVIENTMRECVPDSLRPHLKVVRGGLESPVLIGAGLLVHEGLPAE